ncbi:UNVERIFIED_CONTAM: hypothetical protein RMT77_019919 [Armadillidium vulgare]
MFKIFCSLLALCIATSYGRSAYQFSDGIEAILSAPITTSFSCDGQRYGYYADMDNNCEIFHVCLPIEDDAGTVVQTAHFSFACGNQTVFNQESLTCTHPEDAVPCAESGSLYELVNAEFGRIPEDK